MKKLLITFLSAAFVFLSATSAQAASPIVAGAPQLTDKTVSVTAQDTNGGGFVKTAFATLGREAAQGPSVSRSMELQPASGAKAVDGGSDQWSRDGLSMLAALAIIGGIVLRRFLR